MKKHSRISGKKYENPDGSLESKAYEFDSRPGGWTIATRKLSDGSIERVRFFHSKKRNHFFTKLAQMPPIEFFGERIQALRGANASGSGADYTAQFPGKVRKVSVGAGESVKAGTPLLMVEAMKMEFAVKAASDGVVVKILVVEGMQLIPGQLLIEFEEKK